MAQVVTGSIDGALRRAIIGRQALRRLAASDTATGDDNDNGDVDDRLT